MVVVAAIFLRWLPHYGLFVTSLLAISLLVAGAISCKRRGRVRRAVAGINNEKLTPDLASAAALAGSVAALSLLGIFAVIVLPLTP